MSALNHSFLKGLYHCQDQGVVTILRDTGGSQSFVLSSDLPMGKDTARNVSTVVRGIGMSFVPGPLHCVHVKSKLVTVIFSLVVHDSFPVDWVDFIMGNDLAGGKVYPVPEVLEVAISGVEPDVLAQEHPDLFSVSVLTRTQARN